MSIEYECCANTSMTVIECKKLLMQEVELWVSPEKPNFLLQNDGIRLAVRDIKDMFDSSRSYVEIFSFLPGLFISMRLINISLHYDDAMRTIIKVTDFMLRHTDGDVGLSYELEKVMLIRKAGTVYLRDTFANQTGHKDLQLITVPFQCKALRP